MEGFTPKKLCFKIEPPTIVLFYQLDASGNHGGQLLALSFICIALPC